MNGCEIMKCSDYRPNGECAYPGETCKYRSHSSVQSTSLFGDLWGYQCPTCHIRSGHAYIGPHAEALEQAPTCCGFVAMTPVRIDVRPNNMLTVSGGREKTNAK
jgi:hypothetical protein